ncbi:hypothetical protein [Volucribacter amazonae]|uniref:hypothetical protein n=1 Tax=Volucribacter amazonae TaxID=256731 RepID=UPI00244159E2|nr:hypothetical protein [Volucribacter amazonae]
MILEQAQLQAELTQLTHYLNDNQTRYDLWKEGGMGRALLHATAGGLLTGDISGAAASGATSLSAPLIEQLSDKAQAQFGNAGKAVVDMTAGLAVGAAVGKGNMGAISAGINTDWYNRQLHPSEMKWIKENAKQFAVQQGLTEQEAERILTSVALSQVDKAYSYLENDTLHYQNAQKFLASIAGTHFTDEYGRIQTLFDEKGNSNFDNFAINIEYVRPNSELYNNVVAQSPTYHNNLSSEILWKAGNSKLGNMASQPEKVQKTLLDHLITSKQESILALANNTAKSQQEHGWEKRVIFSGTGIEYTLKGINQGEVNTEHNQERINLQTINSNINNSISNIYSLAEVQGYLSKDERIAYQKANSTLLSLEGLTAYGGIDTVTGTLNKISKRRDSIVIGSKKTMEETSLNTADTYAKIKDLLRGEVTVYRVEGIPNQRLFIDETGNVTFLGDTTLYLNFGSKKRAIQYLQQKVDNGLIGAEIKSFRIPKSFRNEISDIAIEEKKIKTDDPNRLQPVIADPTKAKYQYGLRKEQIKKLKSNIIEGSGKNGNE